MNKRIQQLAMQANGLQDNFFDLNHKELDVFLSKFSELLVGECGLIADIYRDHEARSWPSEVMKERFGPNFGVEECRFGANFGVEE